jgi:hypothetical protein
MAHSDLSAPDGRGTAVLLQADVVDADVIADFIVAAPEMQHALERYVPRDNSMLFGCLDELVRHIALDEPPPATLSAPSMGRWQGDAGRLPGAMQAVLDAAADDDEDGDEHTDPAAVDRRR